MALYRYLKAYPQPVKRKSYRLSLGLISLGFGILVWVGWPIFSFLLTSHQYFTKTVSPLTEIIADKNNAVPIVLAATNEAPTQPDYTNVNVWFPTKPQKKVVTPVNTYRLTIPKLKINKAPVVIGGDDLSRSLIHYGGTAVPGEYGNTVIFGHSTLIQFYNPTDYKTIFSTMPSLKIGDEFFIDYDNITYRYQIFEMIVTNPNDLSNLEQRFDDSYVTLVTCVPPGTYLMRLYVKARLVRL